MGKSPARWYGKGNLHTWFMQLVSMPSSQQLYCSHLVWSQEHFYCCIDTLEWSCITLYYPGVISVSINVTLPSPNDTFQSNIELCNAWLVVCFFFFIFFNFVIRQGFFLCCFLKNSKCCAGYALRMKFPWLFFFFVSLPFIYCISIFLTLLWVQNSELFLQELGISRANRVTAKVAF